MKKKLMALFLALSMAVSLVTPAFAAGGLVTSPSEVLASTPAGRAALLSAWDFEVFQKDDLDKAVEEATVNLFEKTQIMLGELDIPGVGFQWQIAVPDQDLWVDIQGEDSLGLDLSYAKVASLLNEDGEAQVRCEVSLGSLVFQGPIITVDVDEDAKPESEPVEEKEPVVLKGPEVVIHDSQPAEPEEPEAEEPAPESPAPEAPVVPPAQQEPVVEPEVVPEVETEDPATELDRTGLDESVVAVYNHRAAPLTASTNLIVADTNDENNPTYNVVINYVFENNEIVADPYTANLAAGSNFAATVNFPVVQGYLPYLGETQQNSIDLNYTAISQDDTINVVYKPTNVNYTVIHYKQNVGDDNYTEAAREIKQGLTKSTVPEVHKKENGDPKYPGFYALLYERPEIAADGSTVVEVYYDRYYYLMNFDLGGGYGVEPIYARYGADLGTIPTPTKAGYTFDGWKDEDGNPESIPSTMPAENTTYYASWTSNDTAKVTIVFWGENAEDEQYSYIDSAQVNIKPGTNFTYSENGSLICGFTETHTHSAECGYSCGKTEHTHSVEDGCYKLVCTQETHNHVNAGCTLRCTHTHTLACYSAEFGTGLKEITRPSESLTHQGNGIYTYDNWAKHYVLNIGDKWYCSDGSIRGDRNSIWLDCDHTHGDACYTCGKEETAHDHSINNGCYTKICEEAEHTHSAECGYSCEKKEHTHTSSCYAEGAGLDSNLWTFVRSDTVTVAADGSTVVNVYYDRTQKTLTFKYSYNRQYNATETITAKWGQNIAAQYVAIATKAGSTFWSATYDGEGPYTNYFGVMPENSKTYYNRGNSGDTGTMTYYGQDLDGNYTVKLFSVGGVGGYTVTSEDRYTFEGFTYHHGTSNGSSCSGATFYYTRNSYNLVFNDGYNKVKTESVLFEAPLSAYKDFVPEVPSAYEPGSVTFDGWYLNPECTGAEYKLNEHTMPADNVLLYAKWVPTTHKVEFYLDEAALDAGTKLSTHSDVTVSHGSKVDPTPANPTNGSYTFVGWFYMDGETEKAFDFKNMPVNKDLQVYGKWSSNVLKQYTVSYKYKDTTTGEEIEIAAPTTGSGLAGVTKTFEAKGGTDLYAQYQEGYFPVTKSHSLTIDINATEEKDTNVYTFWYVQKKEVPYTVKYLNKETGEPVATEKTVSGNRKAVVTETFVPVKDYMPDAYQKRLVVDASANAKNEIIFYYTKDTKHAYYKITHFTQNTDGKTYTEYKSSEAVGDINETYTAEPMSIDGFTYDSTVEGTVASGVLTNEGLELKLYYTRNQYPYQVRYLEENTGKQLAEPKDGKDLYGKVISESAIDIENYTAVDPTSQTLNIRIEESQTEAKLNIINFYYKEKEVDINYKMVGPDGTVSTGTSAEYGQITSNKDTVKVLSGTAQGSAATAKENYKFVGWYSDAACTKPVSDGLIDGNKITPTKEDGDVWESATYYAKFAYNLTSLTIKKTGCSAADANQSFIFTVKGEGLPAEGMEVIITGNGSVTIDGLTVGKQYTVTEDESWSWRYTASPATPATITLNPTGNEVTISNTRDKVNWLSSSAVAVNRWVENIVRDLMK